jgi:hypothetical protein
MISWESVEMLVLIGVITAGLIGYAMYLARKQDENRSPEAGVSRKTA